VRPPRHGATPTAAGAPPPGAALPARRLPMDGALPNMKHRDEDRGMAMFSRSVLLTGALALCTAHCGGSSTPQSNTPEASAEATSGPEQAGTETSSSADTMGTGAAGSNTTALNDQQIAAIADKINTAEIEQARIAQSKSNNEQVRHFAEMMIEHHGQAKSQQQALGLGSAESQMSMQLEQESRATLETLQAKSGPEFDRAYMQGQVEGHQKALDTIQQLRQSAQSPELRTYLDKLTPQVEQHLEQARTAQQALQASGDRSGTGATGMR
jgi:putative membrane protein